MTDLRKVLLALTTASFLAAGCGDAKKDSTTATSTLVPPTTKGPKGAGNSGSFQDGLSKMGPEANPPEKDVAVSSCAQLPESVAGVAKLTITNHSSRKSNYTIFVNFNGPDGQKVDYGNAVVSDLEPGQSSQEDAGSSLDLRHAARSFTCKVTGVLRIPS